MQRIKCYSTVDEVKMSISALIKCQQEEMGLILNLSRFLYEKVNPSRLGAATAKVQSLLLSESWKIQDHLIGQPQ